MPLLIALIVVALAFDFLNGLHDAANSIATIVSTRVLRPQYAVAWAAFFNFIAFLFFGLHVAETVGRGIVSARRWSIARVIFGALMGAISLEPDHLVLRHPVVEFARADRRADRRRHRQGRPQRRSCGSGVIKTAAGDRAVADDRASSWRCC